MIFTFQRGDILKMTKKRLDAILNVVALVFLFLLVPGMVATGNAWNGFLGTTYTWDAQENTTSLYEGPVVDGDASEYLMASTLINDTGDVEETPSWDVDGDWDQVTISNSGAKIKLIMNINKSADDLLNSKYFSMRVKTNSTQHLKVSLYAVKFDTTHLYSQQIATTVTLGNGSKTGYFNWTATDILQAQTLLNPATTDEVYTQLVFESSSTTNNFTAADVVQYQIHLGQSSNAYAFSSIQILRGVATIGGVIFLMVAFASTPFWNPLQGTIKTTGGTRKRTSKRRKTTRRRK